MIKKWFLWLAMACCSMAASSQIITTDVPKGSSTSTSREADQRSFILLNVGVAVPLGSYGSNSIFDIDAGYAQAGLNLNVNYGYLFNRFVGVTATGGFITQNIGLDELVDAINRYSINQITIRNYEYAGMRYAFGTAGLLLSVPATTKFSIDLKLQAGLAYGIDKGLSWQIQDATGIYEQKFDKATSITFLPNIGLNLRYLVTDQLTVNLFSDFVMANFMFKDVTMYENNVPVEVFDYPLDMRNLNVGLGIGWRF